MEASRSRTWMATWFSSWISRDTKKLRWRLSGDDGIGQRTQASDGHRDRISRLEEYRRVAEDADAAGRAGRDDIAWLQGHHLRKIGHQIGNIEDQVARVGALHR